MAGNIIEWVKDWYEYYYYTISPYDNPQGPTTGSSTVLRGGCWFLGDTTMRTTTRRLPKSLQPLAAAYIGFRCAANPVP